MKKLLISVFFVLVAISLPAYARADFDPAMIIDPFCLFACDDDDEPQEVYNTYTNSNNVNSNVNSPGATVNNSGNNSGNEGGGEDSSTYYYNFAPTSIPATPIYNYNNNVNNNNTGGSGYYDYSSPSKLTVDCNASDTSIEVGDRVTWTAYPHGGTGNYHVSWTGTNGLDGDGTSITKRYSSPGTKNATVTVRSGDQTARKNCESVDVYDNDRDYDYDYYYDYDRDYYDYDNRNIYVSCSANMTFAPVGTRVVWEAYVSGGSGSYRYEWSGSEGLHGTGRSISYSYNSPGTKSASVTVRSGSRTYRQNCSNYVTVGQPIANYNQYYAPAQPVYKASAPAPVTKKVVVEKVVEKTVVESPSPTPTPNQYASTLFSLNNVPWGWVAVLVIIVLLITVIYLIVNRPKI
jgi:hypothetical protein